MSLYPESSDRLSYGGHMMRDVRVIGHMIRDVRVIGHMMRDVCVCVCVCVRLVT